MMMRTHLVLLVLAALPASAENLLAHRAPREGPPNRAELTDGQASADGEAWNGRGSVVLQPGQSLTWDLGGPRPLAWVALQADNDDAYEVELGDDGEHWRPGFVAGPQRNPGLQTREGPLHGAARFVRLTPRGGDGRYAVTELELYDVKPSLWSSPLSRPHWLPTRALDLEWGVLALLTLALLWLVPWHARAWWRTVAALGLVACAVTLAVQTRADPGTDALRVAWVRAMVALVGALAVGRELLSRFSRPREGLVLAALAIAAVLGFWCFVNLGRAQFYDAGRGQPTVLHHYDMRTYYPIARYFPELRFDGVYAASAQVLVEQQGLERLSGHALRDLRTHDLSTIGAMKPHLDEVRARFSDERWRSFVTDMTYFRKAMGDGGYLGSMNDHGGNATPVWFLGAALLFRWQPASDFTLWLGVVADFGLLLLAFAALAWAYGPRTALVGVAVFGAMDFYQFGSNWVGAALRHDWLALWALGLCALKKERWALGGALLAWSGLIRAFPFLALVTMLSPSAFDFAQGLWRERGGFSVKRFVQAHPNEVRVVAGAVGFGAVLFLASSALFGFGAWAEWLHKVSILNRDNHLNNLSVKTYLVDTAVAWRAWVVAGVAVVFFASRRASLDEAAAMGVLLIPIVFNPANYYLHSAFLLTVLGREREDDAPRHGAVWLVLLLMCTASYFTSVSENEVAHFHDDTVVLMVAFGLVTLLRLLPGLRRPQTGGRLPGAQAA
jgi:hypothetical protein